MTAVAIGTLDAIPSWRPSLLIRPPHTLIVGAHGTKAIRSRGKYFMWYRESDGHPETLGVEVYKTIPQSSRTLEKWGQDLREEMNHLSKTHYEMLETDNKDELFMLISDEDFVVANTYEYKKCAEPYEYEIDLDNMVFSFNSCPVYNLDRIPPQDAFVRSCRVSLFHGGMNYAAFREVTPEEYRFNIAHLKVPPLEHAELAVEKYTKHFAGTVPEPNDILSLREGLSPCKTMCLRILGCVVDTYVRKKLFIMYQEIALNESWIGWNGREIACALAAVALLPLHIFGPAIPRSVLGTWHRTNQAGNSEFWWIRKHNCFTLATHLPDERRAHHYVWRMVDETLENADVPRVVYGVMFSLFHCIVLRVDRAAEGSFERTELLDFLPPPRLKSPSATWYTSGMEMLVHLGNLEAADDVESFYSHLSYRWWSDDSQGRRNTCDPELFEVSILSTLTCLPSTCNIPQLPFEILSDIAFLIESPNDLFNFALTCKATMTAAISRLRFPQMRGLWWYDGQVYRGHPALLQIATSPRHDRRGTIRHDTVAYYDINGASIPEGCFQF
ncbi:hypothetical protein NM688_g1237 [Phlebia brevispora]|uniref:Uncharacterized protein n=1 Tax=Phlebia brevispora TaxID=194682 RepID=A0ACC1TCA9_9APHY|nr:hypothetical protein NM688_g1237 [Phlebia brevispora]